MPDLLVKPSGTVGKIHDVTPQNAGWTYVGFGLYRLAPGEIAAEVVEGRETILVLVEGKANVSAGDQDFGELGTRDNVFARQAPHSVYIPPGTPWQVTASTRATLAVCTAPSPGGRPPARLPTPTLVERGKGTNRRTIHPIAMEELNVADSLLVTEVFTPQGHWSSYPPHRHDEDDFPRMTYLEETYYHRLAPADGFAIQRVFTEDGALDETMAASDHDVVLVPRGHHPCAAPYGFELYYLNVMAGPRRNWRFQNHPSFNWIAERDA